MRLIWFLILVGCFSLQSPTLVRANSMKEIEDAFANEGDMGMELMELMEARPIARAILVHSPEEAAKQRGYAMPQLDRPDLPSVKDPRHSSDISELHTAQHESITLGIQQKTKRLCIKLIEHQRKLDRQIEDLKKAGKVENLEELLSQSDKLHAMTAVNCKTPE